MKTLSIQKLIAFTCLAGGDHSPMRDINVQSCNWDTILSYKKMCYRNLEKGKSSLHKRITGKNIYAETRTLSKNFTRGHEQNL